MEFKPVIGIDIGGTAIKGAVVDPTGVIMDQVERQQNALVQGKDGILHTLGEVVDQLIHTTPQCAGIGVGTAGRVDIRTGRIVYSTDNLPDWQGTALKAWIEERYQRPAVIDNDANAALIGEHWLGGHPPVHSVTMLTLGTGVGGANLVHGELYRGKHCQGGEWGHVVLVPGGIPCNCGLNGCIEQYLSGTALVRAANVAHNNIIFKYEHGRQVFQAYKNGDTHARRVVHDYLYYLSLVIHNLSVSLDPELIIIGGGVIHSKQMWWHSLNQQLEDMSVTTQVVPAKLGNQAGMMGAAKLMLNHLDKGGNLT
ncbi:ROK family protein [Caldalkalibacillus salinus]|uniref:ROK family protein n=1 Tax=Caldalkalibacillus salinus TaxID=2803787 RepID=UPI00192444D6|nr:ROK family protein [Caldalkalibacillus salinus]